MTFEDAIVELITSDPSINSLTNGNIVHGHLPVDYNETGSSENWIVFWYSTEGAIDTFSVRNCLEKYSMNTQVVSADPDMVSLISDKLESLLNIYPNEWGLDITLQGEDDGFDAKEGMHHKTNRYDILY